MNRFEAEIHRLYCLADSTTRTQEAVDASIVLNPAAQNGMTRAMVVSFARSIDWDHAATLYQAVQGDLELPAPAVSASGRQGYQVWFSLTEPVLLEQALQFLKLLQRTYLHGLLPAYLAFWPDADTTSLIETSPISFPPQCDGETGKWSAFIDPGMGSMFVEEPGLGMAPMMDRQADLLAGLESIKPGDFDRTLNSFRAGTAEDELPAGPSDERESCGAIRTSPIGSAPGAGHNFTDPKSFLLAIMNDSSVNVDSRIEAARALLPYFFESRTKPPAQEN